MTKPAGATGGAIHRAAEAEWAEFIADCGKCEAELAEKVSKGKLTLAELR